MSRAARAVSTLIIVTVSALAVAGASAPLDARLATWSGAVPDDGQDDTAALQQALDSLHPGDTLALPVGGYQHSGVLTVRVPDVTITGPNATLTATQEQASAFRIAADRVTVEDLTFAVASTTRRWESREQHKVWLSGGEGVVLRGVTITGSAAAGIFVDGGASGFRLDRATVSDTRADGIHITGGAHDGTVESPTTARTGDDGVAVVSYGRDADICSDITVTSPRVLGTDWGRGLSVVGGRDITYSDILVEDSDAAGVYIAVEGDPFLTRPVENVTVTGGTLRRSNTNADIDHGAIVVYSGRPELGLTGVRLVRLDVVDTRPTASHDIGVIADGPTPSGLTFESVTVTGGTGRAYGGNVPRSSYTVEP